MRCCMTRNGAFCKAGEAVNGPRRGLAPDAVEMLGRAALSRSKPVNGQPRRHLPRPHPRDRRQLFQAGVSGADDVAVVDAAAAAGRRADRRLLDAGPDFPRAKAARERQIRRDRRQHAALLAMASALLVARSVLHATPSVGIAVAPVRGQHAALAESCRAAGRRRHGRCVRHRPQFGVPARQGEDLLQARAAGRQVAGAVRLDPSASADAALPQQRDMAAPHGHAAADLAAAVSLRRELAHRAVSGEDPRHLLLPAPSAAIQPCAAPACRSSSD